VEAQATVGEPQFPGANSGHAHHAIFERECRVIGPLSFLTHKFAHSEDAANRSALIQWREADLDSDGRS